MIPRCAREWRTGSWTGWLDEIVVVCVPVRFLEVWAGDLMGHRHDWEGCVRHGDFGDGHELNSCILAGGSFIILESRMGSSGHRVKQQGTTVKAAVRGGSVVVGGEFSLRVLLGQGQDVEQRGKDADCI